MFVVFDMDGTLSDPSHRIHHLAEKDWDSFYDECHKDKPKFEVINTMRALIAAKHRVEIWTGRRESTRVKTVSWLKRYGVSGGFGLRMRQDGDRRHDTIAKGEWLDVHGIPQLVFEDRNSMVKFYRDRGITVAQVALGDF